MTQLRLDVERLGSTLPGVLDGFLASGLVRSGGVVAAADAAGGPVVARAFGSDGDGAPMRPDHRILLTSVTKPVTALQVMQLVERGLLDLHAPVAAVIPEFAANGKEQVTAWHLLTHTSGIDQAANTAETDAPAMTPADHLRTACAAALTFEPGGRWEYCSPGFWVLAEIVTRLSGSHYTAQLETAITGPLGLADTRYEPGEALPERWGGADAAGYEHLASQVRRLCYPAGGIVGTASDLALLGRCLLADGNIPGGGRLLGPAALAALGRQTATGTYQGRPVTWGLGWELGGCGDLQSRSTLFHYGGSGTGFWVDREQGLTVALLTTSWFLDWRVYGQVANAVFGALAES